MKIRTMTPQDLAACVALTQEVKWPHRLADWQLMLALGEGLVAEQDSRLSAAPFSGAGERSAPASA